MENKKANKKAALYTLGCKVNQYETEALAQLFREQGYTIVDFTEKADVYVINTCTVTHLSDGKSRQMIRRAKKTNPEAKIAVMGCYAQMAPEEIKKIPGVNVISGVQNRRGIMDLLHQMEEEPLVKVSMLNQAPFEEIPLGEIRRTRAFIKIEDGCEQFCSYCLIPFARGPVRSRKMKDILEEVKRLTALGTREIVLTGVNLGAYGKDLEGKITLAQVIGELDQLPGVRRIRLSSLEPTDFTMELMEAVGDSEKICPHLHIPLQSGDNETLRRMNRRYTTDEYRKLVNFLKFMMPDLALTTDVMVGFPGEKEENFERSYSFVQEMAFSRLHVFKYSTREGTAAAKFKDQLSPRKKEQRSKKLIHLGEKLAEDYAEKFLGREVEVLFEEEVPGGYLEGFSQYYFRVRAEAGLRRKGEILRVRVDEQEREHLVGTIIN
ncbi:tRNA (N(6)-L-threonylcarbamoyladenosine(37)-C(2))-methylthiotransferase MtaB [Candidatus Contubernalis alkaliaceticus]|uniref:tRNA (N(6)-L-threonylcarbamoyladenosine(37)-C(2))- methylthiotransferase MtaB n=1 Tax=Candidatus Contubernalis alkaliaceticus TaxID=338645 RepID=UPI001F4C15AB|nr:tRNA (N(6)-L-threonylcarbamoyladenosine(37)-C(2))-methylthiotransferase MtaB [Candidatus Contubernalis alkalaceticus]UNC93938.1 tRNA (N(6)-L-threonylcarbamoyladenosine(37)-C(2))-methylthiotransferase MtaB [Candidatus Contubernalis alkalaceticus]